MCEQAARYCRESVHRLLRQQQQQPASGGGLDGLLRWVVTKMSDGKSPLPERELLPEGPGAAGPEQKKGTSVILDVSRWGAGGGRRWKERWEMPGPLCLPTYLPTVPVRLPSPGPSSSFSARLPHPEPFS